MCGLLASVGKPVEPALFRAALDMLAHRGPDGSGVWQGDGGSLGAVALGHRRLAVMAPESGAQPIANETGDVIAIVNGELYGFEAIRSELEARGHRFRTRSDSEILVHLYEEYGQDCVRRLRGEFAFVLWDATRRVLFCGRDPFGIKPLFYAEREGGLLLASEAKALFRVGVAARWNEHVVLDELLFGASPDRTRFAGISAIPPGGVLVFDERGLRTARYWTTSYPSPPEHDWLSAPEAHAENLRARLRDTIGTRLRSDVRVGLHLSSGYDSNAVAGFAQTLAPRGLKAFTVAFDHPTFDESDDTRAAAAELGLELEVVTCTSADVAREFMDAVAHAEMIGCNGHIVAKYRMSRAIRDAGIKVVLSGDGADELFLGYDFCLGDLAGGPSAADVAGTPLAAIHRSQGFVPTIMKNMWSLRSGFMDLVDGALVGQTQTMTDNAFTRFFELTRAARLSDRAPVFRGMDAWINSQLAGYILAGERLDMAHSVEVRLPLLDHELFAYASGISVEGLMKGIKHPLREAAWPHFAERIRQMKGKKPFQSPPSAMVGGPLRTMIVDVLTDPIVKSIPWLDAAAVARFAVQEAPSDDWTAAFRRDLVALGIVSVVSLAKAYALS